MKKHYYTLRLAQNFKISDSLLHRSNIITFFRSFIFIFLPQAIKPQLIIQKGKIHTVAAKGDPPKKNESPENVTFSPMFAASCKKFVFDALCDITSVQGYIFDKWGKLRK